MDVAKLVVPPGPSATPDRHWWFQFRTAMAAAGGLLLALFISLVAFGNAPYVHFNGFARADDLVSLKADVEKRATTADLKALTDEVHADRADRIDTELFRLKVLICQEKNQHTKYQLAQRFNEEQKKYNALTGHDDSLGECSVL